MADFKKANTAPEARMAEARDAQDQGGLPTQNSTAVEAPKLGSESIANFAAGPGIGAGGTKIR